MTDLRALIKNPATGGVLLAIMALVAIIAENSPLSMYYDGFLTLPVVLQIGAFEISKPLLLWINDGLMAIFFLAVGLEIKREMIEGKLSRLDQVLLPSLGAIGGILISFALEATQVPLTLALGMLASTLMAVYLFASAKAYGRLSGRPSHSQ